MLLRPMFALTPLIYKLPFPEWEGKPFSGTGEGNPLETK